MLSGLAEEKLSQWQLSREKQYIILSSDTKPSEVTKGPLLGLSMDGFPQNSKWISRNSNLIRGRRSSQR